MVAAELRQKRTSLGVSQSRLARLSGVSRFKICMYELGDGSLSDDELSRIRAGLQAEASHLRELSDSFGVTKAPEEPARGHA